MKLESSNRVSKNYYQVKSNSKTIWIMLEKKIGAELPEKRISSYL